ncbi:hypothetical protein AB0M28_04685 [Streptomyces sp. NPDC051940]|uniref:hypothetical protein n=1 Tax=Streptomyces sp. NPDC051940 TaxID=3155675 RepID=UPI0034347F8F
MDFFPLPALPETLADPGPAYEKPPWLGPPGHLLGAHIPMERVLYRSEHLVLALQKVLAFPAGVRLSVRVEARRAPDVKPEEFLRDHDLFYGTLQPGDEVPGRHPDKLLRFGVRFPDGRKATTLDHRHRPLDEGVEPTPPVLHMTRRGGGGDQDHVALARRLWLWPLPPPEPFELGWEWPHFGVPLTFATLDGAAIAQAADRAVPLWPEAR